MVSISGISQNRRKVQQRFCGSSFHQLVTMFLLVFCTSWTVKQVENHLAVSFLCLTKSLWVKRPGDADSYLFLCWASGCSVRSCEVWAGALGGTATDESVDPNKTSPPRTTAPRGLGKTKMTKVLILICQVSMLWLSDKRLWNLILMYNFDHFVICIGIG